MEEKPKKVAGEETELDFDTLEEDWTSYRLLPDETILRVKLNVTKIYQHGTGLDYPNLRIGFELRWERISSGCRILGEPSPNQAITAEDIKNGIELAFERVSPDRWQRYDLNNGFTVRVKPVFTKVIRTSKFNEHRQPVYWADIQHTLDVVETTKAGKEQ
jgi:hypothetical protein